ncbi:MAG: aminoacyl-tRNA hydrolase [Polyangiaceae bacterium]|nr:aminoacyl-tRNA hydrolase [Polyangiaceae bacterium]
MWLVVGLGNPGREYASHRHNVGFMAVDELASRLKADSFREKFSAQYAKASHAGEDIVLLKPMTFMNLSGQSVQPAAAFFKVAPANVLVLHDEIDLPFNDLRLKLGGGHAGHNGLRSMIQSLGTPDFARVRIGVGRPPAGYKGEVADFVLSSFDTMERAELPDLLQRAVESVLDVCARGLTPAMNKLNTKTSGAKASAKAPSKNDTSPRSEGEAVGAASPRGKA